MKLYVDINKTKSLYFGLFNDTIDTVSGMVVFRIKGENDLTERLLKKINHRGNIHCVPASLKGKYVIRYVIMAV